MKVRQTGDQRKKKERGRETQKDKGGTEGGGEGEEGRTIGGDERGDRGTKREFLSAKRPWSGRLPC